MPKNALIKQYKKLFAYDGVELSFEDDAIEAIADLGIARKTGARGLRSIMEKVMMEDMFLIPSDDTIRECIVTKDSVEGTGKPRLIHKTAKETEQAGLLPGSQEFPEKKAE